jgi:tetratricopeptide (TPR) repeat protein
MGRPAEAKAAIEKAMGICENVAKADPSNVSVREPLAECYNAMGDVYTQVSNPSEALESYEKLRAYLVKHAEADAAFGSVLNYLLARSLVKSSQLLCASGKLDQALTTCQEALSVSEKLSDAHPRITWLRIELAYSLRGLGAVQRRAGRPKEAVISLRRAIAIVEQLPMLAPRDYYNLACCHAELAGVASTSESRLSVEEGKPEAERAMESLRQAVAGGYGGVGRLRSDASLDHLRSREDFQKLVKELETKVSKMLDAAPSPRTK